MKILLVQDYLRSGGTERQSLLLAHGFRDAGHETTLLTFRPGGALAPIAQDLAPHVLQPFDSKLDWWAPRLTTTARRLAPDVTLCMGRMANCHAGQLQSSLPASHVVATMRTGKNLPWLFRRSLAVVSHIVANSHDARDVLASRYHLPTDKISVIHNSLVFPPTDAPTPRNTALRSRHGASPATVVLLCVAMFRPEKNQRALIDLAARLPRDVPWQLWLAGTGPALAACEARAAELQLADRIKFLGFQPDPAPLYAAADVAVLTSGSESLSNFLIEAQAHGLPAVAYAATGVAETMLPGVSGHVIPAGNTHAFAATLRTLLSSPNLRADMGARGREFARNRFSPIRQIHAYLTLFQRLAAPSSAL